MGHWSTRIEQVREDHKGLYYYRDLSRCLSAIDNNMVFGDAHDHHKLMIVEVEATGRHITYMVTNSQLKRSPHPG